MGQPGKTPSTALLPGNPAGRPRKLSIPGRLTIVPQGDLGGFKNSKLTRITLTMPDRPELKQQRDDLLALFTLEDGSGVFLWGRSIPIDVQRLGLDQHSNLSLMLDVFALFSELLVQQASFLITMNQVMDALGFHRLQGRYKPEDKARVERAILFNSHIAFRIPTSAVCKEIATWRKAPAEFAARYGSESFLAGAFFDLTFETDHAGRILSVQGQYSALMRDYHEHIPTFAYFPRALLQLRGGSTFVKKAGYYLSCLWRNEAKKILTDRRYATHLSGTKVSALANGAPYQKKINLRQLLMRAGISLPTRAGKNPTKFLDNVERWLDTLKELGVIGGYEFEKSKYDLFINSKLRGHSADSMLLNHILDLDLLLQPPDLIMARIRPHLRLGKKNIPPALPEHTPGVAETYPPRC